MTKKLLLVLAIILAVVGMTGCTAPSTPQTLLTLNSEKTIPDASGYEKNLDGLIRYMKDSQVISGDGLDMSYGVIGAVGGKKFSFAFLEGGISCEVYEFDTKNLDETAQSTIASVKEKGFFTALDKEVEAVLSDNGQFMMIYVCQRTEDEYKVLTDRAHEAFQKFA